MSKNKKSTKRHTEYEPRTPAWMSCVQSIQAWFGLCPTSINLTWLLKPNRLNCLTRQSINFHNPQAGNPFVKLCLPPFCNLLHHFFTSLHHVSTALCVSNYYLCGTQRALYSCVDQTKIRWKEFSLIFGNRVKNFIPWTVKSCLIVLWINALLCHPISLQTHGSNYSNWTFVVSSVHVATCQCSRLCFLTGQVKCWMLEQLRTTSLSSSISCTSSEVPHEKKIFFFFFLLSLSGELTL